MNPNDVSLIELADKIVGTSTEATVLSVLPLQEQTVLRNAMEGGRVNESSQSVVRLKETLAEILNLDLQRQFTERSRSYFAIEGDKSKRVAGAIRSLSAASHELLVQHRDGESLADLAAKRSQTYRETKQALSRAWSRIDDAMTEDPDQGDLQRFWTTGNSADANPIFKRNQERITRLLIKRNLVRDMGEAEAVYNDASVRAFKRLNTFKGESKVSTWLTRIAINVAIDARKAEAKHSERTLNLEKAADEYQSLFVSENRPEENIEASELFTQLTEGMNDIQKRIIQGRIEGKTTAEMAKENGVSEGAIKSSAWRARQIAAKNQAALFPDDSKAARRSIEDMTPLERIKMQWERETPAQRAQPSEQPATFTDTEHLYL